MSQEQSEWHEVVGQKPSVLYIHIGCTSATKNQDVKLNLKNHIASSGIACRI